MRILFFDTETTGIGEMDRLLQLAVKERGVAAPIVNSIYKPPLPISIEAMSVHHITEGMVAEQPPFQETADYSAVKSLFESKDTVAVAHNATFDVTMLGREGILPRNIICTYKLASALDPDDLIPKYKLQYLRYLLNLEVEGTAHEAFGDVMVLEALFVRLQAKMEKEYASEEVALAEMMRISARPMLFTTIRFGKYNGKRIEDVARVDPEYLRWLLGEKRKQPAGEADWIYTLEHHLGLAHS